MEKAVGANTGGFYRRKISTVKLPELSHIFQERNFKATEHSKPLCGESELTCEFVRLCFTYFLCFIMFKYHLFSDDSSGGCDF